MVAGDLNADLTAPRGEREAHLVAAIEHWAAHLGLVAFGAGGPTRRSIKSDGQAALDWFLTSADAAGGLEAAASWHRDLSDHACL
eukprot:1439964-Alexandrium_andersonii.AAC.1